MVRKLKNKLPKKIYIKTFGCQMNEYDSNRILDLVKTINYNLTNNINEADCYLLNTCHIREKATEKVYHDVGRVKKAFRDKTKPIVIITGCVAQAEGEIMLQRENYIDAVVGPQSYHEIKNIILNIENKKKKISLIEFDTIEKFDQLNLVKNSGSKTSSFITIQEGCDKFCKFCVVPYTRGPENSRSMKEILFEVKDLVNNGAKEIILLGQNVNAYNFNNKHLSDLLYNLNEINDLKRIRYTTSHPKDFTQDLIEAHDKCKKLMPLLHLPVQSGSSKILKDMNRGHNLEEYLELVEKLKEKKPSLKFSSDFIIGYPGETVDDFNKTVSLLKKINFINSYSFIFSARPGTPAANLKQIDPIISKKRLNIFQKEANDIKKEYRKSLINLTAKVLFENRVKEEDKYFGRDEYFNSVIVKSKENLTGKIKNVKIVDCNYNTLFGETVSKIGEIEFAA